MCYLRILESNPMLNMNTKGVPSGVESTHTGVTSGVGSTHTGVTSGVGSTHATGTPEFTLGVKLFGFPDCFTLGVPDEGYISNVSSALYKNHFRLKKVL